MKVEIFMWNAGGMKLKTLEKYHVIHNKSLSLNNFFIFKIDIKFIKTFNLTILKR